MAAAALLAGLAASAATAQSSDGDLHSAPPRSKAIWDGWFKPADKADQPKLDDVPPPAAGPSAADLALMARTQARADLDRRWAVCEALREIAVRNNDQVMEAQIEQLHDRAWEVYEQRATAVSVSVPPAADAKNTHGGKAPAREGKP
jgi:hypothetical protein